MKIRLSYGTAVKMGLKKAQMAAEPTTAYIMVGEKCISNCSFCAQRRDARKEGYLSRVLWISYDLSVLRNLRGFSRICFQTLDYPGIVKDLLTIFQYLPNIPISVSIVPISRNEMIKLRDSGVEILSIALDAVTPEIFRRIKGDRVGNRFTWEGHWKALKMAKKIFRMTNTHLIVGLGETDANLYFIMEKLANMNISIALFAYTPLFGGEPPSVERYRVIQLIRYLLSKGHRNFVDFIDGKASFIDIPEEEWRNIEKGVPFLTSGCPGCNRPFYNERPRGTIYNYPHLPERTKIKNIIAEIKKYAEINLKFNIF